MPFSIYQASAPVFIHALGALENVITKARAHVTARKIEETVLCETRLFPDMFPFTRQVSLACDFAKFAVARLARLEAPKFSDDEKDFGELKARIARTLDFIRSVPEEAFEGSDDRDVTVKLAGADRSINGGVYLLHFALPNFYFHTATAYAILRENGVELGKKDFIGGIPGLAL